MDMARSVARTWRRQCSPLLTGIAIAIIMLFGLVTATSAAAAPDASQEQAAQASSAQAGTKVKEVEGKTFTIATDTTWAPFEFEKDGELRGIDVDLIKAIAKDQGFNVEIDVLGFDGALAAVQSNQADAVMAGMSITEERKKSFDFSNPYFDSGIQMAVAEKNDDIKSYEDLKGKTVSAKTGTEGYAFAEKLGKEYGFTVTGFQDAADTYNNVTSGHSVATFDDYPVLAYAIQTGSAGLKVVGDQEAASSYGMGVAKEKNEELVRAFNEGLKNVIENGEYQKILEEYLGELAPDAASIGNGKAALGNEQLEPGEPGSLPENPKFPTDTPKDKGKFVIATDNTFAPFVFKRDNELVGIDMDLLRAIAANQGFEVEIKPLGFDGALSAVKAGQADAVIAGMGITEERKQEFDFSDPYFESAPVMAVKKDSDVEGYDALEGKSVAVKTGTTGAAYAKDLSEKYGFSLNTFNDSADMYNDVDTGNSVGAFEDEPVLQYGIKTGDLDLKIVGDPGDASQYGFAVVKGEQAELLKMFNEGLAEAKKSGAYQQILDRYLAGEQEAASSGFFDLVVKSFPSLMQGLGLTLLATALSIFFGMILGIVFGIMKLSHIAPLRWLASAYVNIFRGTPVIVQAFFFYFGVPKALDITLDVLIAGVITLSLNSGAYITEVVRGGVQSVDPGQMEASRSLGMSWTSSMRKVVMPQAFKIMTPNLINQFIMTLKDTSLLSVLGFAELTQQGRIIIAETYKSFEIWILVAIIYFVVIWALTVLSNWLDRKFNK